MNYGFVIDNRSCIGCHACSTACKAENEVPLGVYRTWVKYVEKGSFPNSRRSFQVTRCNHCANPPCVRICPVTAMYQRVDGIVEFDPEVCIGCKACMQACPYDAIYIDPDTGTAAKCHYCSHRTEIGLEPACVVVCPTQAIIAGDLDDPASRISTLVARQNVSVRKPEQGTMPKLFYIEADDSALTPTATLAPGAFVWADLISQQGVSSTGTLAASRRTAAPGGPVGQGDQVGGFAMSGTAIRVPLGQGLAGDIGPIHYGGGTPAEHMVQTAYNAQHKVPWHWPVPAYLVTKGIGAGSFLVMALLFGLRLVEFQAGLAIAGNLLALVFIGITTALLVLDLEKPGRFLSILTRPQWKSWLTRGAFILIGFSAVSGIWFLAELGLWAGLLDVAWVAPLRWPLMAIGTVLALLSAIYTAFLFGQAEGRDLWQSTLLPWHLIVQATILGSGALLLAGALGGGVPSIPIANTNPMFWLVWLFLGSLGVDLLITLIGEFGMPHASEVAARAAHEITAGKYRRQFWWGSIGLGHALPLALVGALIAARGELLMASALIPIAVLAATLGLYLYEHAFVMAPQEVPNS